jgi:glyoxylase-like metal-dependent hydrolase (beta-lactamase superfamily II)/rhodanese-related sulfurtransferase
MSDPLELTALELVAAVESGEPLQVLDVRAPERLAAGRVDAVPAERFHNIPGSQLGLLADPETAGLRRDQPVAVVCARGVSSRPVAAHLRSLGYRARSLAGGIEGWMKTAVARPLAPPQGFDRFVQFDRVGKGALAYLLVSGGEALVVDPPRAVRPILDAAAEAGARVVAVAETHLHADYLSGAPALAAHLDVPHRLHPADNVFPVDGTPGRLAIAPLAEGERLRVGGGEVRVVHTPGHTEGSVTLLAGAAGGRAAALTGDFLFVGSVGRPDIAGRESEWIPQLWASLERARREWPPDIEIRPAHYAGPAERRPDGSVGARFGELAQRNPALRLGDAVSFAAWIAARGRVPPAYLRIKAINLGLMTVAAEEAEALEAGRNECAAGPGQQSLAL